MWTMRLARVTAAVAALAVAAGALADEVELKEGDTAPEFKLRMATGSSTWLQLSSLRGKYVLLVFMTEEGTGCAEYIPTVNDGHKKLAGERFAVVGIVADADRSDVRRMVREHLITYPIGYDRNGKITKSYGVSRVPVSCLLDPEGKILGWDPGTAPQFQKVEGLLKAASEPGADEETSTEHETQRQEWLNEAFAYYRRGELKKAYLRCRQALQADPENVRAHVLLGDIYRAGNQPDKAVGAYRAALQYIDPEDYATIAAAYRRIGNTYVAVKNYEEAVGVYVTALKTIYDAGYKLEFYAAVGTCHMELGNRKKALLSFERFLETYEKVDAEVQKRHADLHKRVEAARKQLAESDDTGDTHESDPD